MAIWVCLGEVVSKASATAFSQVVERIRTLFAGDPELRRQVAFSVAMIALSAKMAKADGVVTQNEIHAFREIFSIPEKEERNVARLYNLAMRDVAGFEAYARQLAGLCGSGNCNCRLLEDIIDGLFHIAKADGAIHEAELHFLGRVAEIFRINETHFARIVARHAVLGENDPYAVLGVSPEMPYGEIRRRYRALVAENHPDKMIARGFPAEFIAIANRRMAAINDAFSMIERSLKPA
jgi:DnaJ like chaperone protein